MIAVTRLDGSRMIVNSDQIAWIECNPDTVISLLGGEKLIVRESPEALVQGVLAFRRAIAEPVRVRRDIALAVAREEAPEQW